MSYTDRLNVDAHLTEALRHLRTAEVIVRNLDVTVDLTAADRCELYERASSISRLTRQIGDELDDDDLDDVDVVYDVREYDLRETLSSTVDRDELAET
ncbi:MAG: hypothetical protein EA388_01370 [Nitriliruptor sp.]|nr:MAG: hypothetical protein EA388_01370 [Nitriliruptor sp.]